MKGTAHGPRPLEFGRLLHNRSHFWPLAHPDGVGRAL